jgi:hypothetical protein
MCGAAQRPVAEEASQSGAAAKQWFVHVESDITFPQLILGNTLTTSSAQCSADWLRSSDMSEFGNIDGEHQRLGANYRQAPRRWCLLRVSAA